MKIGMENEYIEFKKSTSELKEAVISISSILNKHGKGTLYFGVNNSGHVIGQEIGKDTLRNISRDITGHIKPSCWYEVDAKKTETGETFIEINFRGDDAPYSAYGRYYERFADEDRAISDTELEKMFRSRRKDYSDWEDSPSGEPVSSIDEKLLKSIINSGNEKGRLKYKYTNKEAALSKLGLADKKTGTLTNAGNVLLSKKAPVILKLATFSGSNKSSFKKLGHFEGNIFECIDEGIHYILDNISWDIEINGNAKRKEIPEIPTVAVREILINAFAHGFYGGNTTFEIDVFSDRVSIYNPGNFPRGYKPEDFASMAEEPIMLNPKIVNVLFKVGEIESFGSGFERTFTACKEVGVKYEYADTGTGFRFVFFRPSGQNGGHKLSETEKVVYEIIKDNVYVKMSDIAKQIGKSEKTVYRAVKKLKEEGLISREGGTYNGNWVVKN